MELLVYGYFTMENCEEYKAALFPIRSFSLTAS